MATRSARAGRLSKKALKNGAPAARRLTLIQLIADSAILGAVTALCHYGVQVPFMYPIAAYLITLTGLSLVMPWAAVARQTDEGAYSRMTPARFALLIALPIGQGLIVWGLQAALGLVDAEWKTIFAWALKNPGRIALSACAACACVAVAAYVCGAVSVFTRQTALYMAEASDRLTGQGLAGCLKNAMAHAFVPLLLALRHIFWFALALIMTLALAILGCAVAWPGAIRPGSLTDTLKQLPALLLLIRPWIVGASLILGWLWMLGLGLAFRPRYNMRRLYYHRLLLRDRDIV